MLLKAILKGLLTYIPVASRFSLRGTGGTVSARYCYSVWLRHLVWAHENGLSGVPATVAELGPGDSLGAGLAALLSGSERYFALDVKQYAYTERNVRIFDELVELFRRREPIPDASEFPKQRPPLGSYEFPDRILTDEDLDRALSPDRVERIRHELMHVGHGNANGDRLNHIRYFAPWHEARVVRPGSVDLVFSQAVMEHVVDLDFTYAALWQWLKPGGWVSHQIDFKCHHTATHWNGHWTYSDFLWRLIQGNRAYLLNRQPHSTHLAMLKKHDFQIRCDQPFKAPSAIGREQLASRFQGLSDEDLCTDGAFIQAIKRPV